MIDIGKSIDNVVGAAKAFIPEVVNEVQNDFKDVVRTGRSFVPMGNMKMDAVKQLYPGMAGFLDETDPRKRSIQDNLASMGNAALAVAPVPGVGIAGKAAIKGGKTAAKVAVPAAKSLIDAGQSARFVAKAAKEALKPKNYSVYRPVTKTVKEQLPSMMEKGLKTYTEVQKGMPRLVNYAVKNRMGRARKYGKSAVNNAKKAYDNVISGGGAVPFAKSIKEGAKGAMSIGSDLVEDLVTIYPGYRRRRNGK